MRKVCQDIANILIHKNMTIYKITGISYVTNTGNRKRVTFEYPQMSVNLEETRKAYKELLECKDLHLEYTTIENTTDKDILEKIFER